MEFNFHNQSSFSSSRPSSSSANDLPYACQFCLKRFSNTQALGGHQNAHQLERALVRNPQTRPLPRQNIMGAPVPPAVTSVVYAYVSPQSYSYAPYPYPYANNYIYNPTTSASFAGHPADNMQYNSYGESSHVNSELKDDPAVDLTLRLGM